MAARFAGFDGLGGIKSAWSTITDTSLCFYDMQDFQRRLRIYLVHPITEKLRGSRLVEFAGLFQTELRCADFALGSPPFTFFRRRS